MRVLSSVEIEIEGANRKLFLAAGRDLKDHNGPLAVVDRVEPLGTLLDLAGAAFFRAMIFFFAAGALLAAATAFSDTETLVFESH